LEVTRIAGGLVGAWNRANPDHRVERGDHIVAANGLAGDAQAIIDVMKSQTRLELQVVGRHDRRRTSGDDHLAPTDDRAHFELHIVRPQPQASLGLIDRPAGSDGILIDEVHAGGVVAEFNRRSPGKKLKSGDVIVAVNGVAGNIEQMRRELKSAQELTLTIERPQPDLDKLAAHPPPTGALDHQVAKFEVSDRHEVEDGPPPLMTSKQFARLHRLRRLLYAWRHLADSAEEHRVQTDTMPDLPLSADQSRAVEAQTDRQLRRGRAGELDLAGVAFVEAGGEDDEKSEGSDGSISPKPRRQPKFAGESYAEDFLPLRRPQPLRWNVDDWESHLQTAGVLAPKREAGWKVRPLPTVTLADLRAERGRMKQVKVPSGVDASQIDTGDAAPIVHAIPDCLRQVPELRPTSPVPMARAAELFEAKRMLGAARLDVRVLGTPLPPGVLVSIGGPMTALLPTRGPLNLWPHAPPSGTPRSVHALKSGGRHWF